MTGDQGTADQGPGDQGPGDQGVGAAPAPWAGCAVTLLTFLLGAGAGLVQGWALVATWAYCQNVSVPVATDGFPQAAAYVGLFPWVLRTLMYSTVFGVTTGYLRVRFRRSYGVALGGAFLALLLVFALDYTAFSGMAGADFIPARCPGGHLSWWF